mmetsp:Transcript_19169/g.37897  ORF Transcript_19169/g.37897 Transcript_19169/m.37897 type:complete len:118 (-) Transcript_19169:3200-3553(-)
MLFQNFGSLRSYRLQCYLNRLPRNAAACPAFCPMPSFSLATWTFTRPPTGLATAVAPSLDLEDIFRCTSRLRGYKVAGNGTTLVVGGARGKMFVGLAWPLGAFVLVAPREDGWVKWQ